MTDIFDYKIEQKKLAKQYDLCTGVELSHIRKVNRALYDSMIAAKGIVPSYPTTQDYRDRETPERLISVEEAQATSRFSKDDVARYYAAKSVGNIDNLSNLQRNDEQGYEQIKLARQVYQSLEPVSNPLNRRIRPTETPSTQPTEHYSRLKAPAASTDQSENTVVGESLGKRLNLPAETRVSFEDYGNLLLFAAKVDAEKSKS